MMRYLTTEELAELCRTTPATVTQWRYLGKGPRGTRVGKRILYREDDVREWLERHRDA